MRPRKGQRYRSLHDTPVRGVITYRNPSSGSFRGVLPQGEVVKIESTPPSSATAAYAIPERYSELESQLISGGETRSSAYGSYALVISFGSLEADFEVVAGA